MPHPSHPIPLLDCLSWRLDFPCPSTGPLFHDGFEYLRHGLCTLLGVSLLPAGIINISHAESAWKIKRHPQLVFMEEVNLTWFRILLPILFVESVSHERLGEARISVGVQGHTKAACRQSAHKDVKGGRERDELIH